MFRSKKKKKNVRSERKETRRRKRRVEGHPKLTIGYARIQNHTYTVGETNK